MIAASGAFLPLPLPRQAVALPDHPALWVQGRRVSYAELLAFSDRLARQLAALGVGAGDRVALLLPDGLGFAGMLHAAARLEAVLVPLNTRLGRAELDWQLTDAAPSLVVVDGAWRERVEGRSIPVIELRRPDGPLEGEEPGPGLLGVEPGMSAHLLEAVSLASPQTIVYTSGTTGRPKGAVLSYGNHLWSALGSALRLGVDAADRWLAPLPLFHVGGMAVLWRSALAGTTAILPGRFDARALVHSLARDRVTLVSMVPTMLERLLDAWGERPAPEALRCVLLGGGPIPPELFERAVAMGFPVAPSYGLSEAASQVATARPARVLPEAGIAAEPLPFNALRIVDGEGIERPLGERGEILLRGPSVMSGYWRNPEATSSALVDGWLHTGDMGWLDARGRLHVGGRRDDLIVSGGENVYPAEVEAALQRHPEVVECCVLGEPDSDWGQRVVAVVVPASGEPKALRESDGSEAIVASLRASLGQHLAGYKHPRRYLLAPALPRTAAGKLHRAAIRRQIEALG